MPRSGYRYDWRDFGPARDVEAGVAVARPGRVSGEAALDVIEAIEMHCSPPIASRARTYARQGQVIGIDIGSRAAVAQIQGSDIVPYDVSLSERPGKGIVALCDCPYGCTPYGWCKHAAALAYVVADIIDQDPAARQRWSGAEDTAPMAAELPAGLVDELMAALRPPDQAQVVARLAFVAPPPG